MMQCDTRFVGRRMNSERAFVMAKVGYVILVLLTLLASSDSPIRIEPAGVSTSLANRIGGK